MRITLATALNVVALRPQLTHAAVDLSYPEHALEVGNAHAITGRVLADVLAVDLMRVVADRFQHLKNAPLLGFVLGHTSFAVT